MQLNHLLVIVSRGKHRKVQLCDCRFYHQRGDDLGHRVIGALGKLRYVGKRWSWRAAGLPTCCVVPQVPLLGQLRLPQNSMGVFGRLGPGTQGLEQEIFLPSAGVQSQRSRGGCKQPLGLSGQRDVSCSWESHSLTKLFLQLCGRVQLTNSNMKRHMAGRCRARIRSALQQNPKGQVVNRARSRNVSW